MLGGGVLCFFFFFANLHGLGCGCFVFFFFDFIIMGWGALGSFWASAAQKFCLFLVQTQRRLLLLQLLLAAASVLPLEFTACIL